MHARIFAFSLAIELTALVQLFEVVTLTKLSVSRICERGQLVVREYEIAVGTHYPVSQQIGIVRSENDLRMRNFLQQSDDAFGKFVVVESVKFVDEDKRNIFGGLVPVKESVKCLSAA